MSKSANDLFIEFIESFDDGHFKNHKFHDTITEISRKHSGKREYRKSGTEADRPESSETPDHETAP